MGNSKFSELTVNRSLMFSRRVNLIRKLPKWYNLKRGNEEGPLSPII